MFDLTAQPTGADLRAFRLRLIMLDGKPCSRRQLADSIGSTEQNIKDYETEKNGKLMPAAVWVITRIMWDALAFEQFKKLRPKRIEP